MEIIEKVESLSKIPTVILHNKEVFFLEINNGKLWYYNGFCSIQYDVIISKLRKERFDNIVKEETILDFQTGSQISYSEFCRFINEVEDNKIFYSCQQVFQEFLQKTNKSLPQNYRHPGWMQDLFVLLDLVPKIPYKGISKTQLLNGLAKLRNEYTGISSVKALQSPFLETTKLCCG